MLDSPSSILTPWSNFYVIAGSSAGALTGLMFVVITLVADRRPTTPSRDGVSVYSTPTVVHFCSALFGSAILTAPWRALLPLAIVLGLTGVGGLVYVFCLLHRARRLDDYHPDLEDWIWYTTLPALAYLGILVTASLLFSVPHTALFVLAFADLLLIFIGIHNAWDIVTFLAIDPRGAQMAPREDEPQDS